MNQYQLNIDYNNKELLEHAIVAMRAFGFSEFSSIRNVGTDVGPISYELHSMPGDLIRQFDEEGNNIKSELAFLIEAKSPRFTMIFKVGVDSWYDNENPPEIKSVS